MKYVFGIDGGGTKSRITVLNTDLEICFEKCGEATNIYSGDKELALKNLANLIQIMFRDSGLEPSQFAAGCISSAGLDRSPEKQLIDTYIHEHTVVDCPVYYCNDGESLLVGGLNNLEGACLIAGTGALALGRLSDGTLTRAGGYGYMLGDEGSAFWIAHQAIMRSIRSFENRDIETQMLVSLLQFFGLSDPKEFIYLLHNFRKKSIIASCAQLVTNHALNKDLLAIDILNTATNELLSLVRSVLIKMPKLEKTSLVLSGGVIEEDAYVRPRFMNMISNQLPEIEIVTKKYDASYGACLLALNFISGEKYFQNI